jgi:hypothetical protein
MSSGTYDPKAKLARFFPSTPGMYNLSDSDTVSATVLLREVLEQEKSKSRFSVLNLYCNWCVHPEITNSKVGYRTLARVASLIQTEPTPEGLTIAVSRELSIATLRAELVTLLKEVGIPTKLIECYVGWRNIFGGQFLKALLGKRLRFPPDPDTNERSADIYPATFPFKWLAVVGHH